MLNVVLFEKAQRGETACMEEWKRVVAAWQSTCWFCEGKAADEHDFRTYDEWKKEAFDNYTLRYYERHWGAPWAFSVAAETTRLTTRPAFCCAKIIVVGGNFLDWVRGIYSPCTYVPRAENTEHL